MWYQPTNLEIIISNLLTELGIDNHWKLNIYDLALAFDIKVKYLEVSDAIIVGEKPIIVLDSRNCDNTKYIRFLHELSHHILEHAALQDLNRNQWYYYELKANHVMPYIAMPYFEINTIYELGTVEKNANYFCLPHDLVRKRLEGIRDMSLEKRQEVSSWQQLQKGIVLREKFLS